MNKRLIVIGGATGSGKTALALSLAKQYPQLVILSADSRQVYKRLDIGSAKVGKPGTESGLTGALEPVWWADSIPQYLIDIAEPNYYFSLRDFQRHAYRLINACWQIGKIPLLVGGTGLYLQSVAEGYVLEGGIDLSSRVQLENQSVAELQNYLNRINGTVAETDKFNKRRLIRAIERSISGVESIGNKREPITDDVSVFVLSLDWGVQRDLASAMVQERIDLGLVDETKYLLRTGVNKEWLYGMGLSYRLVIDMLDGKFAPEELKVRMISSFRNLMRRQQTWFNRMPAAEKLERDALIERISHLFN